MWIENRKTGKKYGQDIGNIQQYGQADSIHFYIPMGPPTRGPQVIFEFFLHNLHGHVGCHFSCDADRHTFDTTRVIFSSLRSKSKETC